MKRLLPLILLFTFNQIQAQDTGEDLWGNWLMYFGTNRVSDKLSIHTEAQYRLYEFSDNFNQLLLRTGLNYHIADHAMATAGYAFIPTRTFTVSIAPKIVSGSSLFSAISWGLWLLSIATD